MASQNGKQKFTNLHVFPISQEIKAIRSDDEIWSVNRI